MEPEPWIKSDGQFLIGLSFTQIVYQVSDGLIWHTC